MADVALQAMLDLAEILRNTHITAFPKDIRPAGCGPTLNPWWMGALGTDRVKDRLRRPRRGGAARRP